MYKDPERQRAFQREWAKKRRQAHRAAVIAAKSGSCAHCGESDICCLDFHHVDPATKKFNVGSISPTNGNYMHTPKDIEAEVAKCILLCRNCHAKLHAGVIELDQVA
jgi:5-methylcytosine-specific restriction endonuclease McrA